MVKLLKSSGFVEKSFESWPANVPFEAIFPAFDSMHIPARQNASPSSNFMALIYKTSFCDNFAWGDKPVHHLSTYITGVNLFLPAALNSPPNIPALPEICKPRTSVARERCLLRRLPAGNQAAGKSAALGNGQPPAIGLLCRMGPPASAEPISVRASNILKRSEGFLPDFHHILTKRRVCNYITFSECFNFSSHTPRIQRMQTNSWPFILFSNLWDYDNNEESITVRSTSLSDIFHLHSIDISDDIVGAG